MGDVGDGFKDRWYTFRVYPRNKEPVKEAVCSAVEINHLDGVDGDNIDANDFDNSVRKLVFRKLQKGDLLVRVTG